MELQPKTSPLPCFAAVCCWNLMTALDATILSTALPTIARDLGSSSTSTYWAGTCFVLVSAVLQPIFASLAQLSAKWSTLMALTFFTTGSLISALAKNIATLIVGRCLQGAGGGGLLVLTYVLLTYLFDLQQRSSRFGFIGLIWAVGTISGPIIGGTFVHISWRWIFWINLPLAILCYCLIGLFLPNEPKTNITILTKLRAIDWPSCLSFAASVTLVLIALSWGGIIFSWTSVATLLPLLLGVTGLFLWALYSYKYAKAPIVPLAILNDRTVMISYLGTFIQGLAQFCLLYSLPLYYEGVKGYSSVVAGVALLPQCLTSGPATAIVGMLIGKTHTIKSFNLIGWLLFSYGIINITLLRVDTPVYDWIVLNIPSGIGLGILYSSLTMAAQASAERRATGSTEEKVRVKALAAGLSPFFRALGQAFGIVIGQAAFSNQVASKLGSKVERDSVALIEQIRSLPDTSTERIRLVLAFMCGLKGTWWVLLGLTTFMLLVSFMTEDLSLMMKEEAVESQGCVEDIESLPRLANGNEKQ